MLDAIQNQLGIANDADRELAQLELETPSEVVIAEITRVQARVYHAQRAGQT